MLSDFESAAKAFILPEKLAEFKTVSISCQVLQKSPSAEALTAKEFLCYACYYANPYQFLDAIAFVKLPLASIVFTIRDSSLPKIGRIISTLGEKMLSTMREYYRDYLATELMREEEETAKKKSAKGMKKKEKSALLINDNTVSKKQLYDEEDVENYLSSNWEKMRDTEYYKYFFHCADLDNVLTLSIESIFDKKKKAASKKKKRKAKGEQNEGPKGFDVFEGESDEPHDDTITETKAEETKELDSEEEANQKTKQEQQHQEEKLQEDQKSQPDQPSLQKSEATSKESVVKHEEELKVLPRNPIKRGSSSGCIVATMVQKNQKPALPKEKEKEKKKHEAAFDKMMKEEYEKLRKAALKIFSEKTGAAPPPVNHKPKKSAKKKKKKPSSAAGTTETALNQTSTDKAEVPAFETNQETTLTSTETNLRKVSSASCSSMSPQQNSHKAPAAETRWRKHSGDFRENRGRGYRYRRKGNHFKETAAGPSPYLGEPIGEFAALGCENCVPDVELQRYNAIGSENYCPEIDPQPGVISVPFYLDPRRAEIAEVLNGEIISTIHKIEEYNNSLKWVCELVQGRIQTVARGVFRSSENVKTALYGSMAAGLALPSSDIDVAVLGVPVEGRLEELGEVLAKEAYVTDCKVISTARVPVIKLVISLAKLDVKSVVSEIKVDVTIDTVSEEEESTTRRVSLVKNGVMFVEWIQTKLKEIPGLKEVVLIMKMLLADNKFNVPYHGKVFSC